MEMRCMCASKSVHGGPRSLAVISCGPRHSPLQTRGNHGEPSGQPIHSITRLIRAWHTHTPSFFFSLRALSFIHLCNMSGVEGFNVFAGKWVERK